MNVEQIRAGIRNVIHAHGAEKNAETAALIDSLTAVVVETINNPELFWDSEGEHISDVDDHIDAIIYHSDKLNGVEEVRCGLNLPNKWLAFVHTPSGHRWDILPTAADADAWLQKMMGGEAE